MLVMFMACGLSRVVFRVEFEACSSRPQVLQMDLESYFDGQMHKNRLWRGIVEGELLHSLVKTTSRKFQVGHLVTRSQLLL